QVMVERNLTVAQSVEHVLDHMREGHDVIEREKPGRAFDRVHTTKQRVELLRVLGARLDFKQVALHFFEHFTALGEERVEYVVQIHWAAPRCAGINTGSPRSAARLRSVRAS